jgi:hypothetical protein
MLTVLDCHVRKHAEHPATCVVQELLLGQVMLLCMYRLVYDLICTLEPGRGQ